MVPSEKTVTSPAPHGRPILHLPIAVLALVLAVLAVPAPVQAQYAEMSEGELVEALRTRVVEDVVAARPIILELIKRAPDQPQLQAQMETYVFLAGLSYQDEFSRTEDKALLKEAIQYYREYLENYPQGMRRDFVRFNLAGALSDVGRWEEAVEAYRQLYERSETVEMRREARNLMCALYIRNDAADRGLGLFLEMFEAGVLDPELRAQAAAWLLQGYLAAGEPAKILPYLRFLTGGYEATFDPKFNVTLLQAGDGLFEKGNYDQAILLYSLVKTREQILDFYDDLVRSFELKLSYLGPDSEAYTVTEGRLNTAKANLEAVRDVREYEVDMEWRIARVYLRTGRAWEALWAFYHLYENYPEHGKVEDFLFIAISQAKKVGEKELVEKLGLEYLAADGYRKYRDQVIVDLAGFYNSEGRGNELLAICNDYLADPGNLEVAEQLINYCGQYFVRERLFARLSAFMQDLVVRLDGKEPALQAARYWHGLGAVLVADYQLGGDILGLFLDDYTEESPYYEDAWYRHAICQYGLALNDLAEDRFTRFVETFPDSRLRGEAELYLGDLKRERGALDEALAHYDRVGDHTENLAFVTKAVFAASEVLESGRDPEAAIGRLEAYIDSAGLAGEKAEALRRMGMIRERQGRFGDRFEYHTRALREMGGDPRRDAVDRIIRDYVDDYREYTVRFSASVDLLERLLAEPDFATAFLTDRGFQYSFLQTDEGRRIDSQLAQSLIRDREFREKLVEIPMAENARGEVVPAGDPVVKTAALEEEAATLIALYQARLSEILPYDPAVFFRQLLEDAAGDGVLPLEMRAKMAENARGEVVPAGDPVVKTAALEEEAATLIALYQARLSEILPYDPAAFFRQLLEDGVGDGVLPLEMRAKMALDWVARESSPPAYSFEQLAEGPPAVLLWAADKRRLERPDEARRLYTAIIEQHPFSEPVFAAMVALGEMAVADAEQSGTAADWESALTYFNLVTERFAMRAGTAAPFLRKGYVLSKLGRHDEAVEVFSAVLRNPEWRGRDHAEAHLRLGLAYMQEEKWAEAHGFFERMIVAYGGFGELVAWAYYYDLITLEEMGRQESVEQLLAEYRNRSGTLSSTEAHRLIDEKYDL